MANKRNAALRRSPSPAPLKPSERLPLAAESGLPLRRSPSPAPLKHGTARLDGLDPFPSGDHHRRLR